PFWKMYPDLTSECSAAEYVVHEMSKVGAIWREAPNFFHTSSVSPIWIRPVSTLHAVPILTDRVRSVLCVVILTSRPRMRPRTPRRGSRRGAGSSPRPTPCSSPRPAPGRAVPPRAGRTAESPGGFQHPGEVPTASRSSLQRSFHSLSQCPGWPRACPVLQVYHTQTDVCT